MRKPILIVACLLPILAPVAARAQTAAGFTCTNTGGAAPTITSMSLSVGANDGNTGSIIGADYQAFVLDQAECYCNSQDLAVVFQYSTGVPATTVENYAVWAGASCANTSPATSCEQITGNDLTSSLQVFQTGSGSSNLPWQKVPVRSVIAPSYPGSTVAQTCPATSSNAMWFLFGNTPDSCSLPLQATTTTPVPPIDSSAGSGDEGIVVSWTVPTTTTTDHPSLPAQFQVLCSDSMGNPLPGQGAYQFTEASAAPHQLAYSTCVGGTQIQRRANIGSASGTTGDGGVVVLSPDLGVANIPLTDQHSLGIEAAGDDLGAEPVDMAVPPDMNGAVPPGGTPGTVHFPNLDKKYVCSDVVATGPVRIGGLTNGQTYYFLVVGIDTSGNPSFDQEVSAQPEPVQDLYRRFLAEGGTPQGFCFIATAAWGSYQHPYVMILRDFRDQVLLPTEAGSAFVAWYYRTSPPYAQFIARHDALRFVVRMLLWPVIIGAGLYMWLAWWQAAAIAVALAFLLGRKRVRALLEKRSLLPTRSAA